MPYVLTATNCSYMLADKGVVRESSGRVWSGPYAYSDNNGVSWSTDVHWFGFMPWQGKLFIDSSDRLIYVFNQYPNTDTVYVAYKSSGTWSSPIPLTGYVWSSGFFWDATLSGDVLHIATIGNKDLYHTTYTIAGGWGTPDKISSCPAFNSLYTPKIINDSGDLYAVFTHSITSPARLSINYAPLSSGIGVGTPLIIESTPTGKGFEVQASPLGNVFWVTHVDQTPNPDVMLASYLFVDFVQTTTTDVVPSPGQDRPVRNIALLDNGDITIFFNTVSGSTQTAKMRTLSSGTWGAITSIGTSSYQIDYGLLSCEKQPSSTEDFFIITYNIGLTSKYWKWVYVPPVGPDYETDCGQLGQVFGLSVATPILAVNTSPPEEDCAEATPIVYPVT